MACGEGDSDSFVVAFVPFFCRGREPPKTRRWGGESDIHQETTGHHKKMFLNLPHQAGLAQEAQSLCRQFTDYKEERFAAPAKNYLRGTPDPENRGPLHRLTWASLNIRSIYGREKP